MFINYVYKNQVRKEQIQSHKKKYQNNKQFLLNFHNRATNNISDFVLVSKFHLILKFFQISSKLPHTC